jgi:DTW domain
LKRKLEDVISEEEHKEIDIEESNNIVYTLDNLPIKKAVFIDSTWKQCRSIYRDPKISSLNCCIIQNRLTKFWRSQKDSPDWYLATIEAIHQFLMEFHIYAFGIEKNYFDNCLSDFKLINTDWIPKHKIIESEKDSNVDERVAPYCGQYDNILYYFSFIYALIHSLESPSQRLPAV